MAAATPGEGLLLGAPRVVFGTGSSMVEAAWCAKLLGVLRQGPERGLKIKFQTLSMTLLDFPPIFWVPSLFL